LLFIYQFASGGFFRHQKLEHYVSGGVFISQHRAAFVFGDQNSSPFIPFPLFPMEIAKEATFNFDKKNSPTMMSFWC
jgi:hypothetical protein